ncbi:MAG: response regulator [Gammaproteobacteria bacterium]|nr:response regulator [Gammaproteobacteria bacterium]MDH3412294.1 response regulator [Gammaproteobacteria bacterium]
MTHVQNSKGRLVTLPRKLRKPRPAGPKGAILLVEDNPMNQRVARYVLKILGYEVHVAVNGIEAVEMFKNRSYDLILMDCHMPVMDGYEATRQIREMESRTAARREVPIIAVTADVLTSSYELCFEVGMNDFLPKPYEASDLRRILNQWLPPQGGGMSP